MTDCPVYKELKSISKAFTGYFMSFDRTSGLSQEITSPLKVQFTCKSYTWRKFSYLLQALYQSQFSCRNGS